MVTLFPASSTTSTPPAIITHGPRENTAIVIQAPFLKKAKIPHILQPLLDVASHILPPHSSAILHPDNFILTLSRLERDAKKNCDSNLPTRCAVFYLYILYYYFCIKSIMISLSYYIVFFSSKYIIYCFLLMFL